MAVRGVRFRPRLSDRISASVRIPGNAAIFRAWPASRGIRRRGLPARLNRNIRYGKITRPENVAIITGHFIKQFFSKT